jgi:hypothetical protein
MGTGTSLNNQTTFFPLFASARKEFLQKVTKETKAGTYTPRESFSIHLAGYKTAKSLAGVPHQYALETAMGSNYFGASGVRS